MADRSDFPWRPGMVNTYGWRVRTVRADGAAFGVDQFPTPSVRRFTGIEVPDLTDPATVGALAGGVREAWRSATAYARQSGTIRNVDGSISPAWEVCDLHLDAAGAAAIGASRPGSVQVWGYRTEADAWLAAWQARPKEGA